MKGKDLDIPLIIKKLEAALRRTPFTHPSYQQMKIDLAKYRSGYRGQQSLDYYFKFLDENKYCILRDLRLPYKDVYFQMDTTILSTNYISLLEVKNNKGTLEFDLDFHQMIQRYEENGVEVVKIYDDPIQQVQRQRFQLASWLTKKKYPSMPIEYNVVISNSSTRILPPKPQHRNFLVDKVIRPGEIQHKIYSFQNKYQCSILTVQELQKLAKTLIKAHQPPSRDVLIDYLIYPNELIRGVQCTNCLSLPMIKVKGGWLCGKCKYYSKKVFKESLKDYFLLYGPNITNAELRDFLLVPSPTIAAKLLQSLKLTYSGSTKDRIYFLSLDKLE